MPVTRHSDQPEMQSDQGKSRNSPCGSWLLQKDHFWGKFNEKISGLPGWVKTPPNAERLGGDT
jgi:hypothetical protein